MNLADQYKARFASPLRSRGEDILLSRGVFSATRSEHTIRGEVRSSSQAGNYNVEVRLSRLRPAIEKFSCTCPYFDDAGVCKHLWAFLRTIDILQLQDGSANPKSKEADIAINKPRSSERPQVPEWKSVLSNLNDEFSRQSHNNRTFSSISDVRPQQFWYIINLDSLQNSSDTIIIRVMTQLIKTNGQAGSLKEFRLESREIGSVRDEVHNRVLKDLEELSQLERISQYSSIRSHYYQRLPATSEVKLSPSRHTTILQRIAATGRLCWRLSEQVPVDNAQFVTSSTDTYWEPKIEFIRDAATEEWVISGHLISRDLTKDSPETTRPLTDILLLTETGVCLLPESLSSIRISKNFGWLQLLRRRKELRIPFRDHADFLTHVLQSRALREMPLPDEFCPIRTDVPCRPLLRFAPMASLHLDGKTTNRQEVVDRFQSDPNCPLFLISLKAGGHGLNLTAADYVFILDPWWNPAVEAQAVDRAHRLGQQQHVFAYRLISKDTVEERILEMQKEKRELAEAVISADPSLISSLSAEDLTLLLS